MLPLIPFIAGLAAIVAGWLTLRSFGPRYRVGRLLATSPEVSVADAIDLAAGPPRYIRVRGRIDSETEFEDQHHRPLVFRRTRLDLRRGRSWIQFDDRRERVPFEIRDGLAGIAVDDAVLDAGLIVMPRESTGTAADAPDHVPSGTDPGTPVRLRVDQVSSVEHAIATGVPRLDPDGRPTLGAGLGRPLVLSTLEEDEAMRVLAADHPRRPLVATLCLAAGFVLVTVAAVIAIVGAIT